jgi:hypothetical protein
MEGLKLVLAVAIAVVLAVNFAGIVIVWLVTGRSPMESLRRQARRWPWETALPVAAAATERRSRRWECFLNVPG